MVPGGSREVQVEVDAEDPLHQASGPGMEWTLANTSEALPGVLTPLTWTFWRDSMNLACRRGYYLIGALAARDLSPSPNPLENYGSIFYGRYTASLELRRRVVDVVPGTTRKRDEGAVLGGGFARSAEQRSRRRYPYVFTRGVLSGARTARELERIGTANHRLWVDAVAEHAKWSEAETVREFELARTAFRDAMGQQVVATFLGGFFVGRTKALAQRAGYGNQAEHLISGGASLEEAGLMDQLWRLAHGTGTEESFLAEHGYHGDREGSLDGVPWRMDARPIASRLAALRQLAEDRSPARQRARQRSAAARGAALVVGGLPLWARPFARLTIRLARHFVPLREVGKRTFLQAIDVARMAALRRAELLVARGVIEERDDIHYLTDAEFLAPQLRADLADIIAFRRARRLVYESLDLPERWVGDPVPVPLRTERPSPAEGSWPLQGIGVGTVRVEGVARVVSDPVSDGFEPEEILVCRTTDPSWIPLIQVAAALVTDIGSGLSHAAIIARELGVPCVVNTGSATRQITTGDRIAVDPLTGTVAQCSSQPAEETAHVG
jgi:pyruvate,water dikinase